jgi:hypothetical protein
MHTFTIFGDPALQIRIPARREGLAKDTGEHP